MESTADCPDVFASTTVVYSDLSDNEPPVIAGAVLSSLQEIKKTEEAKTKILSAYLNILKLLFDCCCKTICFTVIRYHLIFVDAMPYIT